MGNGLHADLHEFELTPRGTALLIAYDAVRRPEGRVVQAVVQEVDIETGLVLFEWHSIGNIALSETFRARPSGRGRWDYMHLNSVALDAHGDFIVSARPTHAVYRLSRPTGRVLWRLGGRSARTSGSARARASRSSTTRARSPTARSRSTTTAPPRGPQALAGDHARARRAAARPRRCGAR